MSIRFIRDVDGDLYIEILGKSGWFALGTDFCKGEKYVDRYQYTIDDIEIEGPITEEHVQP